MDTTTGIRGYLSTYNPVSIRIRIRNPHPQSANPTVLREAQKKTKTKSHTLHLLGPASQHQKKKEESYR